MLKTPPQPTTQLTIDDSKSLLVSFSRAFRLGLQNFWRNKFLSLATIIVMAIILFIFNTILTINVIANQAIQNISHNVDFVIYLRDDVSFFEGKNLAEYLQKIDGVKTVKYTSKDDALANFSKNHGEMVDFLSKLNVPNPFPPSISIVVNHPEDYEKIKQVLETNDVKQYMKNYIAAGGSEENAILNQVGNNLINIQNFVRQIIFWVILVFMIGGTLVVINAIQLTMYTRRQEIAIMRLVGATPNFIRLPFLLEGIFYSVGAVVGSFVFLYLIGTNIHIDTTSLWTFYQNLELGKIFLIELLMTIMIGLISSLSAIEQYWKRKLTSSS